MISRYAEVTDRAPAARPLSRPAPRAARAGATPGVRHGGRAAVTKRAEVVFYLITKQGGALVALWWIATHPSGWVEWSGFAFFYVLNMLAFTLCYHRYFVHQGFETSRPMRWLLGIWGQLGVYGSILGWCADHRRHHARADRPGDPHSPFFDGNGRPLSGLKGIRHAHAGWLFNDSTTDLAIFGKGLVDDPVIRFCHRSRFFWYAVSALLIPALWALAFAGPEAIVGTILIAGFLRLTAALHAVAILGSLSHGHGTQRFPSRHKAGNNFLIAILTLGEGWHNNHHAHPRAAIYGTTWREVDLCGWLVVVMERLGLIWNVQRMTFSDQESR